MSTILRQKPKTVAPQPVQKKSVFGRENEIGSLWIKVQENGDEYMTGDVNINGERTSVIVFKNKFKVEGEKTPDFRMYLRPPPEQQ